MKEDKLVRITLNARSQDQLLAVMDHYEFSNPTHMVQTMITQLYKALNQSRYFEDSNDYKKKEMQTM